MNTIKSLLYNGLIIATFISSSMAQYTFKVDTTRNPPLTKGNPGKWDGQCIFYPKAAVIKNKIYMIYIGTEHFPGSPDFLGLAVSSDGYAFTKSDYNPILYGDGDGFDAYSVGSGVLYYDKSTWYLYYAGSSNPGLPGNAIGRATATDVHGPYETNDEVLVKTGNKGAWDSGFIFIESIVKSGTKLFMYYTSGDIWNPFNPRWKTGLTTSTDGGITWKKYDDPATTSELYAESDPVLDYGAEGIYNIQGIIGCSVLQLENSWILYYCLVQGQSNAIYYATSHDGIKWQKHEEQPLLTPSQDSRASYNIFEGPSVVFFNKKYFLYYDYGPFAGMIGMAVSGE
jgi:hypothetical protein